MFAKKDNSAKNVSASTHLLCPEGEGQKYNAAVKWGLPVISKVQFSFWNPSIMITLKGGGDVGQFITKEILLIFPEKKC